MKVLIAGATGVLGRRLVQQLRDRGHSAIALVRSAFMRTDNSITSCRSSAARDVFTLPVWLKN